MKHAPYSTDRRDLEPIGALVVRDETGTTHRVTIRREDLTGTNGAYRAIRDTVTDTLRDVLAVNRATPLEDRKHEDTVRVRIEYDQWADWSWLDVDHYDERTGLPTDTDGREHDALAIVVETRCPCCETWGVADALSAIDMYADDRSLIGVPAPDGGPYSPDELATWVDDYPPDTGRHYLATEALEMVRAVVGCTVTPRRDARTIVLATPHDVHGWTGVELELAGQWPTPVPGIVAPSTLEERDTLAVVLVDGDTVHVRVPVRTHGRTRWTTVATGAIRDGRR